MNIPYIMKRCTKCGEWKVASTINFHRSNKGRYGLASQCKECRNKKNKRWRLENKEKIVEYSKRWYENNKDKKREYDKQYRETNREKKAEYDKRWYEANKEKDLERKKQYYEANKKRILEHVKQYRQSPQGQAAKFNERQRRRTKEQQGAGITKDQWLELMSFFDWKCAYSGETLTDKTRSVDHIVPLNSNGDNMIWNMVPMTRSLNSSKHTSNMEEWYKEQDCYDPKRLAKIYEWQEYAYNKYGKDTEYFNSGNIQIKLL